MDVGGKERIDSVDATFQQQQSRRCKGDVRQCAHTFDGGTGRFERILTHRLYTAFGCHSQRLIDIAHQRLLQAEIHRNADQQNSDGEDAGKPCGQPKANRVQHVDYVMRIM